MKISNTKKTIYNFLDTKLKALGITDLTIVPKWPETEQELEIPCLALEISSLISADEYELGGKHNKPIRFECNLFTNDKFVRDDICSEIHNIFDTQRTVPLMDYDQGPEVRIGLLYIKDLSIEYSYAYVFENIAKERALITFEVTQIE